MTESSSPLTPVHPGDEIYPLRPTTAPTSRRPPRRSPTSSPRERRYARTAPRSATSTSSRRSSQALEAVGITRTFAIQELTLPIALAGNDLIGQARTGTGKTLGFGVPLLNRLDLPGGPGALPRPWSSPRPANSRCRFGRPRERRQAARRAVLTIYGGRAYEPQIEALRKGVDVVVGTPGRLLDLAQQGHLSCRRRRILVLDEADEMLDLGFLPDIEKLLALVPAGRQTMLFSATMPGPIVALARQFLIQPIQIRAEHGDEHPEHRRTSTSSPTARTRSTRSSCWRGCCRPRSRPRDDLHPHQAHRREGRRRPRRARVRRGRRPRRPRPGRPRAGAARVPLRQGRRAGGHRRRGPRARRRRHHARHQLPGARGRDDLRAPHRPHRARRRAGQRDHALSTGTTSRAGS